MPNPVTAQDVENRWRPLSDDELTTASTLLADVWAIALFEVPDLETRLTAEDVDIALVRLVLCAAVLRVLKNPDGKQQESLEDYSYTMGAAASPGTLFLSDAELVMLRPAAPSPTGAFTIRPWSAPDLP